MRRRFHNLSLLWMLSIVLTAAPGCGSREETPAPSGAKTDLPSFLVIDIDSWRADRLGATRNGLPLTPTLDGLAANGTTFTQMIAQSGWTLTSYASLMNGRLPPLTETVTPVTLDWLDESEQILPEILGLYGYDTAAFPVDTLLEKISGIFDGFDTVGGQPYDQKEAASWIRSRDGAPFFALIHDQDLHAPAPPPPLEFVRRYHPAMPALQADNLPQIDRELQHQFGSGARQEHLIAWYDAALAAYDQRIADLLAVLDETGRRDDTVIILTSDHGEALFEHGKLGHGRMLYETVIHVPLVIVDPAKSTGGRSVDALVQTIDLPPTILERAGIPVAARMSGSSLLPLLDGGAEWPQREVVSMTNRQAVSLRGERYKLVFHMPEFHMPRPGEPQHTGAEASPADGWIAPTAVKELFDLQTDPGETVNLVTAKPQLADEMEARLSARLDEHLGVPGGGAIPFDAEARRFMQERGYWEVVQPHGPPKHQPSPKHPAP